MAQNVQMRMLATIKKKKEIQSALYSSNEYNSTYIRITSHQIKVKVVLWSFQLFVQEQ